MVIIAIIIVAVFVIMKTVAAIRSGKSNINDDNPYLHPDKADVLPEDMRSYINKMPPNEGLLSNAYEKFFKRLGDRYNNIDHSMCTSFETVKSILTGSTDKENVWNVNTEKEYHEESKK